MSRLMNPRGGYTLHGAILRGSAAQRPAGVHLLTVASALVCRFASGWPRSGAQRNGHRLARNERTLIE